MLLQTLVVLVLLYWVVEEYLNNFYFEAYVNSFLQGTLFSAIVLFSIAVFSVIAIVLYMKLRRTGKELQGLLSSEKVGSGGSGQLLDNRAEQHLIEMVRKNQPIINYGSASAGMAGLRG